jgi:hypothetical protein
VRPQVLDGELDLIAKLNLPEAVKASRPLEWVLMIDEKG